ncbi:MAG TPA: hypothetical protein VFG73_07215 [Rhodanobacteraceae bacterium]|nr:hypothetical protein [Rhodanobacteraceae bacterium]
MLALATRVVTDYGKVLASVRPDVYALPESLLPHPKESIRQALRSLLKRMPLDQLELREGLVRGYVYLTQFIPDADAAIIAAGQAGLTGMSDADDGLASQANRLINAVKADMERALEEVRELRPYDDL